MMKNKKYSFKNYLKEKGVGVDVSAGLAGDPDKKTDFSYPEYPQPGLGTSKPLPYKNPDDQNGEVLVARDDNNKKPALSSNGTPGIDNYGPGLTKPKIKIKNPQPAKELKESLNECVYQVYDLFGNAFTPDPNQTIKYIVSIIENSPRMMDRLIIEMINNNVLLKAIESMMQHQICFDCIVDIFGKQNVGKEKSNQLAKAMHDKYISALDAVDIEDDFSESVDAGVNLRFSKKEDLNSTFGASPSSNPSGVFGKSSTNAFGGNKGVSMDGMNSPSVSQGMSSPADNTTPDFGTGPLSNPVKKFLKAETAAGNLFKSSASFSPLKKLMEDTLRG